MKTNELSSQEKNTINKMFLNSHKVFHNFNMTKMEANGFTMTMSPAIEEIYKDDAKEKKEAYIRHQAFFNTHAVALNFIAGLSYALERDYHNGKIQGETINAVKASIMGPTAGMFDSLFFNCIRVIASGIAIGICATGNILGSILFIILYGGTQSVCKYYLTKLGYVWGSSFIEQVYHSGLIGIATKSISILGLIMVGAMTATTVNFPLQCEIPVGNISIVVQDLFDAIYPGIMSVILVLLMMRFIKKGRRPSQLIFGILLFGLMGAFLHIF